MYDIRLKKRRIYNCRNILVHVSLVEIWDESWRYKNGWKLIGYKAFVHTPFIDWKKPVVDWYWQVSTDKHRIGENNFKKMLRKKFNEDRFDNICQALESNKTMLDIKGSRVYRGLRGFFLVREENYDTDKKG